MITQVSRRTGSLNWLGFMPIFVVLRFVRFHSCIVDLVISFLSLWVHECRDTQQRMVSYSNTDGCKCGALEDAGR